MTGDARRRNPDGDEVDRFLAAIARGDVPATDPLAALFTAATAAPPPDDAARQGEERMLAEFRAAGGPRSAHPRPERPRSRRPVRIAVVATLTTLAISGMAVAAERQAPPPVRAPSQPALLASTPPPAPRPVTSQPTSSLVWTAGTAGYRNPYATSQEAPPDVVAHPQKQPSGNGNGTGNGNGKGNGHGNGNGHGKPASRPTTTPDQ